MNTQANRPIAVATLVGMDQLLLVRFSGREGISQLFSFTLDVLAENGTDVPFEKLVGQPIAIRLDLANPASKRFFHGICSRVSQGESDDKFTSYRLEMVPAAWLLTRKAQSRIFQYDNVKTILEKVLKAPGLKVDLTNVKGKYEPRDFCVQYRETDFNFASRLMEEEGIFYFFTHKANEHTMVVADNPGVFEDLPFRPLLTYKNLSQGAAQVEDVIYDMGKSQALTPGKVLLWDHCFQIPHQHLEAEKTVQPSVKVGQVEHPLATGNNDFLEVFDWPGEYAERFDDIDRGGNEKPEELEKIFVDNQRTTDLRMEQETAQAVSVDGAGSVRHMIPGFKCELRTEAADIISQQLRIEGKYLITSVSHYASVGDTYRSGRDTGFDYHNRFTLLPDKLPFRPQRTTPKPTVAGSQTAVVVGPENEEIFTDKYGRIKVQFHWDRDGQFNADSSCWLRVGTPWAGKQWGMIHIPRIGQEVIVDFLEGDPDQPIVVGSVYNAEMMPPYQLPDNRTQSGIKSRSSLKGDHENFNEIRFEDKKGKEEIVVHAERNLSTTVEVDESRGVGHDRSTHIGHDDTKVVKNDEKVTIQEGSASLFVDGHNRVVIVKEQYYLLARDIYNEAAEQNITVKAATDVNVTAGTFIQHRIGESANYVLIKDAGTVTISAASKIEQGVAGNTLVIDQGNITLNAGTKIELKVGSSSITIESGKITLKSGEILIDGGKTTINGSPVKVNC